jgi:hypothetical protein
MANAQGAAWLHTQSPDGLRQERVGKPWEIVNWRIANCRTSRRVGRSDGSSERAAETSELRTEKLQQIVRAYGSGNQPKIHNSQFTTA